MPRASHLNDLEVFCRAAEHGRFAAAADALRLPRSSVSRAVRRLEARLGASLFTRTTRRIALTEQGATLFQVARQALGAIEEAELAIGGAAGRLVGLLRIALPTSYGNLRVLPRLPAFQALHPGLRLEVHVTNRVIDLVEEGFDVVVRLGRQPDSGLIARTLEHGAIGTFAAPDYLARHGAPQSPDDLPRHRCIGFVYPGAMRPLAWEFVVDGRHVEQDRANDVTIAYDPLGMVALAAAGGGLIQTGRYVVAGEIAAGRLVEVLAAWSGVRREIVALYPPNRRASAKVRAFLDFFGRPGGPGDAPPDGASPG